MLDLQVMSMYNELYKYCYVVLLFVFTTPGVF